MKKRMKAATLLLATVCAIGVACPMEAEASKTTSFTYTLDENKNYIRTQDAYLPERTVTDLGLNKPQDLFVDEENQLYIADGGNRRIIIYDIDAGQVKAELTHSEFALPKGVFVTKDGDIYVADTGAKSIFQFGKDLQLIQKFTKPDTPSFSDTNFEPAKIAVDSGKNMYVVGEGVYNGVMQFAHSGDFLGYFTANQARLTMSQRIRRMFATREQRANLVDAVPDTFSNLCIDNKGTIYTTTMGSKRDGMKKHNTAGGNIYKETVFGMYDMTDVWVDDSGIIYACGQSGYIEVFSKHGELIFDFGSYVTTYDIAGLFSALPAIAVDQNGNIWTVDGEKGYLQSFVPTEYALMMYEALDLYEGGFYEESLERWNEVLRLNQMSVLAHDGVGKAYLHSQRYQEAMEHFKVSGNRKQFSEAFWEVRNEYIQTYLPIIFYGGIILAICWLILRQFYQKNEMGEKKKSWKEKIGSLPVFRELVFSSSIIKHPVNKYYEIRKGKSGSVSGATFLYVLFFLIFMLYQTSKGYIYQYVSMEDLDINAIIMGFFVILGLFIICNYLVTSINDGDGSFAQVYMIPAYGSAPLLISMTMVILLSYVFTYNEAFLLTLAMLIGGVLSIINIFTGLQTVHAYSGKETVKSLVMTVVFMVIAAIVSIIVIILWEKLYQFIFTVLQEVVRIV